MRILRKRKRKVTAHHHPPGETSLEQMCLERRHHKTGGRFENPWGPLDPRTLAKVIRWKLDKSDYRHLPKGKPPHVIPVNLSNVFNGNLTVTYLGHASLLIQLDGIILLTDPVFSNLSPYLKRKTRLPLSRRILRELTHAILISHNHYDHLSLRAIRFFRRKAFITPLGFERYFHYKKYGPPQCLDWFDQVTYESLKITFLPTQHWSRRTLWDTNLTLWGGFLIEGPSGSVFFGGDTGYFPGFRELGDKFHIDIAILPIGAFAPRWLMKSVHLSPYEAVKVAMDLKATTMIPCHWGTYQISDEPLTLPLQLLKKLRQSRTLPVEIAPLLPGETFIFKG
jgi:L-ascorbate metabolism protein UlaG (beta-lactamase superfamily)